MVMAPPPIHDSAESPSFHGCLAYLHRHFPHNLLIHTFHLFVSNQQTADHSQGFLHNLYEPSATCYTYGTCVPLWDLYDCGKDCLILIPFRLPQISCFTLSLECFSSDSDNCPSVGIRALLQFPPPSQDRSSPAYTPVFPPSSFAPQSFVWFCIFFPAAQVLLSALSWCSAYISIS